MSLSVGAVSSLRKYSAVTPLNYAVQNQSRVSDAYLESVQAGGEIDLASPVSYPNARKVSLSEMAERAEASQKADREYNAIAARYADSPTYYQADRSGSSYSMIGSGFDAIA